MERLRPKALQRSQAWQLIRQLGAGLQHAHERGVVHGHLKPLNILVTREGELRILDFGCAPNPGTLAYASCEVLEGRPAEASDDLYALACICYELLTGTHPFAHRSAIQARNFGVKAARPAGLSGRQWRTLQAGLSWHRAGRSIGVHAWLRRLTQSGDEATSLTPLGQLAAANVAKPRLPAPAVAAMFGMVVIAGVGMTALRDTAPTAAAEPAHVTPPDFATQATPELSLPAREPAPAASTMDAGTPGTKDGVHGLARSKGSGSGSAPAAAPAIAVDGYEVSSGDKFVEVRVHRNQLRSDASFVWWTEPATARQDVDYVQQSRAFQSFRPGRRSTRFYVKLLPDSADRSQRNYFYVVIAPSGHGVSPEKMIRAQIWLPTSRERLQARR
jgi:hypothetical protein